MGMHPRWIRADLVCSTTQRTVDRQYLLKSDPFVHNAVGASAARALKKFPVKLYWLEHNINHEQTGMAPMDDSKQSATNLVRFKQLFHRLLAEELNRHLGREGAIFSTPSRDVPCIDDESVERQFYYALTNPVKDGLCDRIRNWGGFSSYAAVAEGKEQTFTYIDRTAWHRAGGVGSGRSPETFSKTIRLEFTPLPGTEHMKPEKCQSLVRRRVREIEQASREQRKAEGRSAMTASRMARLDHRNRPRTRPPRTPKPLCHASSHAARRAFKQEHRAFLDAYRQASIHYRQGHFDIEFPRGSFRPPLLVAAA